MAFWGMKLKPKKPGYVIIDEFESRRLRITQATLGLHPENQDGPVERTIIKCRLNEGPVLFVASLKAGVVESVPLNLYFDEDAAFSITGPIAVHLTGYLEPFDDDDDDFSDDGEDASDYESDDFIVSDEDEEEAEEAVRRTNVTIEELDDLKPPAKKPVQPADEDDVALAGKRKAESEPEEQASEDEDGLPVKGKKAKTSDSPAQAGTPETLSAKKKKKKNKKNLEEEAPETEAEKSTGKGKSKTPKKKFANGLEIENLKMGKPDGKQAKAGKKVMINYIGKLKSGKIFDSTVGKKPFLFRLGVNEVVRGFDIGVEGMRVGDKRRVTIPPSMGYGEKSVGPIPPNSWLFFDIELVDVKKG